MRRRAACGGARRRRAEDAALLEAHEVGRLVGALVALVADYLALFDKVQRIGRLAHLDDVLPVGVVQLFHHLETGGGGGMRRDSSAGPCARGAGAEPRLETAPPTEARSARCASVSGERISTVFRKFSAR